MAVRFGAQGSFAKVMYFNLPSRRYKDYKITEVRPSVKKCVC